MNKPSPFPQYTKPRKQIKEIDIDLLKVERDIPIPKTRSKGISKYHKIFSQLWPNSNIKCESHEMGTIAKALRKAIKEERYHKIKGCKVIAKKVADGTAKVWVAENVEK